MLTRPQNDAFTRAAGLTIRGNFQYFSERTTMPGIRSMTGYAIAQGPCALGHVTVELRSVNSRFLDLQVRFPDELRPAEQAVRTLVTQSVARGKFEVRANLTAELTENGSSVSAEALTLIKKLQQSVVEVLPEARPMSVAEILAYPGVVKTEAVDNEALSKAVAGLVAEALKSFSATCEREGAALSVVLTGYCDKIDAIAEGVRVKMPEIVAALKTKLTERLEEALAGPVAAKSALTREEAGERIRQEVTLYSLKVDVDEEINRLKTHTAEVRRVLQAGGAVGKRLDFLMQEMNREANTLGSKAAAIEMTDASVNLKLLIEQMREQIQNLQ